MKLKVCGMKYHDNISKVVALKPDYIGFIFYEKSNRFFNGSLPFIPESIKKVGVFVDASLDFILERVKKYQLDVIQLHGQETPDLCIELKSFCHSGRSKASLEIIKVFSIKDHFNFEVLKDFEAICDFFLFDTKGQLPGGNGYTFNWEVLKDYPSKKPFFLSGGIGLSEVKQIKTFLKIPESMYCHAIDINSKFEIEPGLKHIEKLEKFKHHVD